MAKCNEIISKMMLYDNKDEHKSCNADSEEKSALQTDYSPCSIILTIYAM